ncbi:OmpH family outer membrane protein [Candidatus Aerophobetes bacterium]|nr:OmpH family outer membrane protein [Candidatus Aerophobetes bacterium]
MLRKLKVVGITLSCVLLFLGVFSSGASCDILEEVFKRMPYIDLERVFQEYEKKKDLELKLEKESEVSRDRIRQMREQLEDLRDAYERQEFLLTEEAKRARQQEIMDKVAEVESLSQKLSEEIQGKQQEYTQELLKDIMTKIEEIAKKEGYIYVFDKMALIYAAPAREITERIITELNKDYRAKKQ